MGSVDAEVEIDMEISDDEQEGRAVAGQVVDGRVVKQNSSAGPTITDSILIFLIFIIMVHKNDLVLVLGMSRFKVSLG